MGLNCEVMFSQVPEARDQGSEAKFEVMCPWGAWAGPGVGRGGARSWDARGLGRGVGANLPGAVLGDTRGLGLGDEAGLWGTCSGDAKGMDQGI